MVKLFAVRDIKADSYFALHPCATEAVAKRSLAEAVEDVNTPIGKNPEDYQLYEVGSWEANSGTVVGLPVPQFICSAIELRDALAAARSKAAQLVKEAI